MRRLLILGGTATAAAALIAVPANPAAAHDKFHSVEISGNMYIVDDEWWPQNDETKRADYNANVVVGPFNTIRKYHRSDCAGGEVRAELDVDVEDLTTRPGYVRATATVRLFEGASCSTDDLEDTEVKTWDIPAGGNITQTIKVSSDGFGGGDKAEVKVAVRNTVH